MHVVETKPKKNKPEFHCSQCGACCMSVEGVEGFEELTADDGSCKLFDKETHLCTIYDERPLLCRVDEAFDAYYASSMSWEEYLDANYKSCKELREALGIPEPGKKIETEQNRSSE